LRFATVPTYDANVRRGRTILQGRTTLGVACVLATALLIGCKILWSQFDGGPDHQGNNTLETSLNLSTVASVTQKWKVTLPHYADGAPSVAFGVNTPNGSRDLVVVTTTAGDLVALDLETGATIWSASFGPGACKVNNGSNPCFTTSSPVVDQSGGFVYTYGLDGKVHKVALGTGVESRTGGWPEVVTVKAFDEKGSSALAMATAKDGHSYLYAANSGYPGDNGDYQGHITAIDLASGAQRVFNSLCSNQAVHFVETPGTPDCAEVQSGVWARSGVTYSSVTDRVYFATGNGTFDPSLHDWGDSIVALNPDGTGVGGNPVDTYTPTNFQALQNGDTDLGSTLPGLVAVPAGSLSPTGTALSQVGVQGGKDGKLRLVDPANLSGHSGPGFVGGEWSVVGGPGGEILTAPAVWASNDATWIEVATDSNTAGYTLTVNPTTHIPQLNPVWNIATGNTSPLVANGVLYAAGGGTMHAYNPTTGALLWSAPVGGIHWQSPVVDGGYILLADGSGALTAWAR
jgi:outer membrane protein assembly factor BamB